VKSTEKRCGVKIFLMMIVLVYAPLLWAGNSLPASEDAPLEAATNLHTLNPVVVHATSIESGAMTIGGSDLEMMPSATGSITEALKGMSQIQYDYQRQSSLTVGEITPPRISISGARPYENNFMIDGMSVTNSINPSGFDSSALHTNLTVGGGDASVFYDAGLLESITVHSSNVSARHGGFIGGVVDAQLRDPAVDRWRFSLSGRYTNDSMFDLREVDKKSDSPGNQPRFSIYSGTLSAEGPLNERSSLLLAYMRRHSEIPLKRERPDGTVGDDKQTRTNENFFTRLVLTPDSDLKLSFDLTYAPYEEYRWRSTWLTDSEYRISNEAWRWGAKVEYVLPIGVLSGSAAYSEHGFSRESASNVSINYRDMVDDSNNYRSGGVGDAIVKNHEAVMKVHFKSDDFHTDRLTWTLNTGVDYVYRHTDMWNEQAGIINLVLRDHLEEPVAKNSYSLVCHNQEDIARSGTITALCYDEYDQSHHMGSVGGYAETEVLWGRLLVRPGLRADYDNFSGNVDVAPRFKAEVDTFDNGVLRLFFGANRYYGQQLRAYAFNQYRYLRSYIFSLPVDQEQVNDPQQSNQVLFDRFSRIYSSNNLDTPYSNEISAGIIGAYSVFNYSAEVLQRNHKKLLISERDGNLYYMTNNGSSRYEAIHLALSTTFAPSGSGVHIVTVGGTRSKTTSSFGFSSYDADTDVADPLYGYDRVYYNGDYRSRFDMPAANHSSPWIVTLSTSSRLLNDHLRLYSVTRWRNSAKGLLADTRRSDETPYGVNSSAASSRWFTEDGRIVTAYKSGKISGGATTDITTELDAIKTDRYNLTLILEVLNIFNGNMQTGIAADATGTGAIHGRGFYLGARMTF